MMRKIQIMTDSASDISYADEQMYGISFTHRKDNSQ